MSLVKLEVVRELVLGTNDDAERLDALVYAAIYLKWINTGSIPCYEDGGHHRPNHHAEISRQIFWELERIYSRKDTSPQELLVIRKIHRCLPSFKQEIKHMIQNKLHRCAGPEDLIAIAAMLERTPRPRDNTMTHLFSSSKYFIMNSRISSMLQALRNNLTHLKTPLMKRAKQGFHRSLECKKALDNFQGTPDVRGNGIEILINTIQSLNDLREIVTKGLESGIRNDAPDSAIAMRQKWRLAEIELEDYAFVLMSRYLNALDAAGGAQWLAENVNPKNVNSWKVFDIGFRNV